MKTIAQKAKKYTSHMLHEIRNLGHRQEVTIGGKITEVLFLPTEPETSYITIDDDIDECKVYLYSKATEAFRDMLVEGKEVLLQGFVTLVSRKTGTERQIACYAMAPMPRRKTRNVSKQNEQSGEETV